MKRSTQPVTLLLVLFALLSTSLYANYKPRKKTETTRWSTEIFKSRGFIENSGQLNGIPGIKGEVVFQVDNPQEQILFTRQGISFLYTVPVTKRGRTPIQTIMKNMDKEKKEKEHGGEEDVMLQQKFSIVSMTWKGANPNVKVVAEEPLSEIYYTRNFDSNTPYKSKLYKKITYKDLYPGIDLEYVFHPTNGLKYTVIVHPGADPSRFQMQYSDNTKPKQDGAGNIYLETPKGSLIDHKPVTFNDNNTVASEYIISGNTVSFRLGEYDNSKDLIIDPWTVSPGFTQVNKAYDLVRNNTTGDVYAYGGWAPYEVKKIDNTGNIIWTYVTNPLYAGPQSNYYGDIAIDPAGDIYLAAGCCSSVIIKISGVNSNLIWQQSQNQEPWRLMYDVVNNRLIAAGYVTFNGDNICALDPNTGNQLAAGTIIGPVNAAEIRAITITPSGNVHCLHVSQYPTTTPQTNQLSGNSSAFVPFYTVQSGYLMGELGALYATCDNNTYCSNYECFHGVNALVTDANYIYTYDGAVIFKRSITTGAQVATVNVPGGIPEENSGIVIDSCGKLYVGTGSEIRQYDTTLAFISSVSTTTAVYDLVLGASGEILACGDGFVSSVIFPCANFAVFASASATPTCNGDCNGTATATIIGGVAPFTYSWSNGQTTQNSTGLCAGTYTLMVIDSIGDTVTTQITMTQPPPLTLGGSATQTPCGASQGTGTVNPTGGTGPYSYAWTPGSQTANTATGLASGSYTCVVTDANGCTAQQVVNVPAGPPPTVTASNNNANCFGQCFATATAVGSSGTAPYSFSWSNGATGANITGLCAGTYTCIVTDNFGCTGTSSVVTVTQPPAINTVTNVTACTQEQPNGQIVVTVSGGTPGYSYLWNTTPAQTTDTASGLVPGTYMVIITDNNNCPDTVTAVIDECPKDSIHIPNVFTPNGDGKNDNFIIFNIGYRTFHCDIYNRWGSLIYSWNNPAGYWNGELDGSIASDGTYYYVFRAEKMVGDIVEGQGFFHLLSGK